MPAYYTKPLAHWVRDSNLWLDPIAGEAIAENILDTAADERAYIPTGFCFEQALQAQPDPVNMETGQVVADIPDWAFATAETAQRIADLLGAAMPELNYARVILGQQNARFPYVSVGRGPIRPRVLHLSSTNGGQVVINAGLVAWTLARHMSVEPQTGQVREHWGPSRDALAETFRDELRRSADVGQLLAVAPIAGDKFAVVPSRIAA